jgi:single-stranded-DNA-specific exonuclease
VHVLNIQRQELSDRFLTEARAQVEHVLAQAPEDGAVLVVAQGEGWPLGIIGLVAGRLAEDYHRPVLAVSFQGEECRGSMRGPVGRNLVQALAAHADLLIRYGGHAQAAGFTASRANLPTLVKGLRAHLRAAQAQHEAHAAEPFLGARVAPDDSTGITVLSEEPEEALAEPPRAPLIVDCRLPLRSVGRESYDTLRALAPFGPGFPTPLFVAQGARVVRCWRSGPSGRTLRLVLRDGPHERQALWSHQGEMLPLVRALDRVDVVYRLELFTRSDADPECVMRVEVLGAAAS